MYNDNQCPVFIYSLQAGVVSWRVLSPAKEEIENPVMIDWGNSNYGVMVPYGGYLEITTDSTKAFSLYVPNYNNAISVIQPNTTVAFKVVSNCVLRGQDAS